MAEPSQNDDHTSVVHSAVYCGFPAALDASRKLTEVLDAAKS